MDYQSGGGGARGCFTCKSIPVAYLHIQFISRDRALCQERICTASSPFGYILLLVSSTCEVIFITLLESLGDNPTCSNRLGPQTGPRHNKLKLFSYANVSL